MSIVINGSGTISGISVGGLPDSIVDAGTLATNSVDSAELIDGAVDNSHMAAMAASKLTGALPAISGASLTGLKAGSAAFAARSTLGWQAINVNAIVGFNNDSTGDSFDTDGVYNSSSYKFTAPAAGVYLFWYGVYCAQADSDNGFGYLKNSATLNFQSEGDNYSTRWNGSVDDHIQTATIVVPLASGDTMAVCCTREGDYYGGHSQWGGCRLA